MPGDVSWGRRRRVVVVDESSGRSRVSSDGPVTPRFGFVPATGEDPHDLQPSQDFSAVPELPPGAIDVMQVWTADSARASAEQPAAGPFDVESGAGQLRTLITRMGPDLERPVHRTSTTDVDVVLEGEVTVVLDDGEVLLRRGDVLVLPAARHGWHAGPDGCTLLVTMIGHPQS